MIIWDQYLWITSTAMAPVFHFASPNWEPILQILEKYKVTFEWSVQLYQFILPVSSKLVWNETTWNLCHNVTPEKRSMDKAHRLWIPLKLCCLKMRNQTHLAFVRKQLTTILIDDPIIVTQEVLLAFLYSTNISGGPLVCLGYSNEHNRDPALIELAF